MKLGATKSETASVRAWIRRSTGVRRFTYVTHAEALRDYNRAYPTNRSLAGPVTAAQLPASFRIELDSAGNGAAVMRDLQDLPAVDQLQCIAREFSPSSRARSCRPSDRQIAVFMQISASAGQTAAVEATLETARGVRSSRFVSRDEALFQAKAIFGDNWVELGTVSAADLPESFEVVLRPGVDAKVAAADFGALPGVDEVSRPARRPVYC